MARRPAQVAHRDPALLGHVLDHLDELRRRSSVSGGKLRRMECPSLLGFSPRSECWIAFSMAPIGALSYGVMSSWRASGTWKPASCWSGTSEP